MHLLLKQASPQHKNQIPSLPTWSCRNNTTLSKAPSLESLQHPPGASTLGYNSRRQNPHMQLKCYYSNNTNCTLRAKLREEAAGGCLRKFQMFLALDCPTYSKNEEFVFNGSKQRSFKYHLTSQGMRPAVPFQVCPVPAVRACYRRCVIGVCICVINVQEKGILQNERLLFIISLKKENLHSLLNVQNAQHPN